MANKSNGKNTKNSKNTKQSINKNKSTKTSVKKVQNKKTIEVKENNENNTILMKTLVFFGVIILSLILIYLMYHFFVEKSDIKINMSTDKQMEYIMIEGQEELLLTQKYVSDLLYTMRYDTYTFKVFKYKGQDIYKNLNDERVLVVVEKSTLPSNCVKSTSENEYNNCYIKLDNYTEENYISSSNNVYKITVKTPGTVEYTEGVKARINHMLKTFTMTK